MGFSKRPRDETAKGFAYESSQHKAWGMLMVANCLVVILLNSLLLPITEEVRECAGQRTINANVLYYSKF